jgi:hypothetical protein
MTTSFSSTPFEFPETLLASPLERRLFDLTLGNSIVQALYVAAELDIAARLADGPQDCQALAEGLGVHAEGLYRVLRFLARLDILAEVQPRRFALTLLAEPLRDEHPRSLRKYIQFRGKEAYATVGELLHCLKTGESGFRKCHGVDRPEYLRSHPQRAQLFSVGMSAGTEDVDQKLTEAYDFAPIRTLAHLGGLDRTHVLAILRAYPGMHCVFLEQPHAVEPARQRLAEAGVLERCRLVVDAGLEALLAGADACMVGTLHRSGDDEAVSLLRRCRDAMRADARLLLIEKFVNDKMPWTVLENDLTMLVSTGAQAGRLRAPDEFLVLLERAGLRMGRFVALDAAYGLLEAWPEGA